VICTAVHKDNPLPNRCPDSVHHIFSKAYDTETKKLLDIHKMNADKKPLGRLQNPHLYNLGVSYLHFNVSEYLVSIFLNLHDRSSSDTKF
jgi:hypothetical protein